MVINLFAFHMHNIGAYEVETDLSVELWKLQSGRHDVDKHRVGQVKVFIVFTKRLVSTWYAPAQHIQESLGHLCTNSESLKLDSL